MKKVLASLLLLAAPVYAETRLDVALPPAPVHLAFDYGTERRYGDGANFMVRVNGSELWKKYRPQVGPGPGDSEAHQAPPIAKGTADLSAYAEQVMVLELSDNGKQSGGSETLGWAQVRFEK